MTKYYRIDLHFGAEWEVSKKEFYRKIKSKWYLPVWDSYWQTFSENTILKNGIVKMALKMEGVIQ